ncbi:hypothetical protein [Aeromicrobium chenweiae]|nr:hypothetical protein [Aeromicrobium chenweiae]
MASSILDNCSSGCSIGNNPTESHARVGKEQHDQSVHLIRPLVVRAVLA